MCISLIRAFLKRKLILSKNGHDHPFHLTLFLIISLKKQFSWNVLSLINYWMCIFMYCCNLTVYNQYKMFLISVINTVVFKLKKVSWIFHSGDSMVSKEYTGDDNLLGMLFTTYDQDNDEYSDGNCGAIYGGGWWFKWCHIAHLHGPWASSEWIYPWYPSVISGTYIQETLMMVKPNWKVLISGKKE